jgi:hypothetical protein
VQLWNIKSQKHKALPFNLKNLNVMKFIVSLFALVLFFAFALAEAAKGITYYPAEQTVVTIGSVSTPATDLTVAQTPRQEKAGFSF